MITQNIILSAGQTVRFYELGNFVRVLNATALLTIRTYKNSAILTEAVDVTGGYAEQFDEPYQSLEIYSATAQTVQIASRLGSQVYYDQAPTGNVSLVNPVLGVGANTNVTVTTASSLILAANANRKYLIIQNKDASGNIYINFGATATVANGLKLPPGASYELDSNVLTAAINAIGDIASNTNIVIITG